MKNYKKDLKNKRIQEAQEYGEDMALIQDKSNVIRIKEKEEFDVKDFEAKHHEIPRNWILEYEFKKKEYSSEDKLPEFNFQKEQEKSKKIVHEKYKDRPVDEIINKSRKAVA